MFCALCPNHACFIRLNLCTFNAWFSFFLDRNVCQKKKDKMKPGNQSNLNHRVCIDCIGPVKLDGMNACVLFICIENFCIGPVCKAPGIVGFWFKS